MLNRISLICVVVLVFVAVSLQAQQPWAALIHLPDDETYHGDKGPCSVVIHSNGDISLRSDVKVSDSESAVHYMILKKKNGRMVVDQEWQDMYDGDGKSKGRVEKPKSHTFLQNCKDNLLELPAEVRSAFLGWPQY